MVVFSLLLELECKMSSQCRTRQVTGFGMEATASADLQVGSWA